MKHLNLLFILFLIAFTSTAQSNYRAAYAVKNNGDTLKGYINLREGHGTPRVFDFKKSPGSKEIAKLNPTDFKSISIKGFQNYISYSGLISMDKTTYPDLPTGLDSSAMQATIFLEVIVPGEKVSLLLNTDDGKSRLFIKEKGTLPHELIFHYYYIYDADTGPTVHRTGQYKYQLSELINKYAAPDKHTNNLLEEGYNQDAIEKIVWHINGEKKPVKKASNSSFFIGAGINQTKSTTGQINSSSNSISPVVSLGINIFGNPQVQRFIFRLPVSYTSVKPNFPGSPNNVSFIQNTFSLAPELIYNIYNTDRFKYFISAGISYNYSSYSMGSSTASPYYVGDFQVNWLSLPFRTGITLNKKIEIYAMFSTTLAAYESPYKDKNQSFGAGINYVF